MLNTFKQNRKNEQKRENDDLLNDNNEIELLPNDQDQLSFGQKYIKQNSNYTDRNKKINEFQNATLDKLTSNIKNFSENYVTKIEFNKLKDENFLLKTKITENENLMSNYKKQIQELQEKNNREISLYQKKIESFKVYMKLMHNFFLALSNNILPDLNINNEFDEFELIPPEDFNIKLSLIKDFIFNNETQNIQNENFNNENFNQNVYNNNNNNNNNEINIIENDNNNDQNNNQNFNNYNNYSNYNNDYNDYNEGEYLGEEENSNRINISDSRQMIQNLEKKVNSLEKELNYGNLNNNRNVINRNNIQNLVDERNLVIESIINNNKFKKNNVSKNSRSKSNKKRKNTGREVVSNRGRKIIDTNIGTKKNKTGVKNKKNSGKS